jgi:DNA-directed RNA polymerase subunit RPC12/RpoP
MYKCIDCGETFEEPVRETIMHWEVDTRLAEHTGSCPYCNSDDFEELILCPACKENYIDGANDICKDCTQTVYDALNRALDGVKYELGCEVKPLISTIENWLESLC